MYHHIMDYSDPNIGLHYLMGAVKYNTLQDVQNWFDNVNLKKDEMWFDYKLLIVALNRKHKAIINFLLNRGCRVRQNNRIDTNPTPLHYAVRLGDINIVRKLLKKGASILDKDNNQENPFCLALRQSKFAIVDAMLAIYNFDNDDVNEDNLFIFHIACLRGEQNIIKKLISKFPVNSHANLGDKKWNGYTPLHFAVVNGCRKTIHHLLTNNANVFAKNAQGLTPLHLVFHNNLFNAYDINTTSPLYYKHTKYENPVDDKGVSHFHICCSRGTPNIIQFYFNNGVDVNKPVGTNSDIFPACYYPLHIAVEYKQEKIVEILLKHGANVNVQSKAGKTPLHVACHNGDLKIIELLLKFNADISLQDMRGCTPIHNAFYFHKRTNVIDVLLSNIQKDINYTDCQGLSHFHIACTRDDANVVEIFLKGGVPVNICVKLNNNKFLNLKEHYSSNEENYTGYSAIHFAVDFNRKNVVLLLLQYGANVNINLGKRKITPLHLACMYSNTKFEVFEDLTQYGSNLFFNSNDHIEIIKALLNYKADVNARDLHGKTPLVYACEINNIPNYILLHMKNEIHSRLMDIIQILLNYGADIHVHTSSYKSLLHVINKEENLQVAKLFLSKGIDVDAADEHGLTALHEAVIAKNHKLAYCLLDHNANINAVTKQCMTPLHFAILNSICKNTKDLFIETLLAKGCDLNKRNVKGQTPLHMALDSCRVDITQQLLDYGADINSKDIQGHPIAYTHFPEFDSQMKLLILNHIKKLDALGLYIHKEVRDCYMRLNNSKFLKIQDEDFSVKCLLELQRIKHIKVHNSSLYELLKDEHEMSKHVENESLETIVSSKSIERDFPLYIYLIKLHFKKGIARRAILKLAKDALDSITNCSWPDLCSEQIFRYLTYENLQNLIKTKCLPVCQKRKLNFDVKKNNNKPLTKLLRSK